MNFYHSFLLLLVVFSAYSESPQQHVKPPDYSIIPLSPHNTSTLVVLAPVLPQSEMLVSALSQNGVYSIIQPLEGVYNIIQPLEGVYNIIQLQNGVFKMLMPQNGVSESVFCQLSNVDTSMDFLLNLGVKSFKFLTSTLSHHAEKSAWAIRILLECLQHILKMYTWFLSENQASVQFRCRFTGLLLRRSLFRKHDFAVCVYKLYHSYHNLCFQHLQIFSAYKNGSCAQTREEHLMLSNRCHFYGGGKALIFALDELLPYVSVDLHVQQYLYLGCVKKDNKHSLDPDDGNVLCSVPLNVLAPKLTLKTAKDLANLHHMYMLSKILVRNAQILLENHKCETCPDLLSVFKPYKAASDADRQQTYYQKNKEKHAEYHQQRALNSEFQESHKKTSQKHYWSKKDVKFPPAPPSAKLYQTIVSDFAADTSPEVFEEAGCAICRKLTPICEMEELFEVENINLLKVDGVTRKARSKNSDPVRELKGPVLASHCNKVCPVCVDSLDKKKMPTLVLANGLWIGDIPPELQDLTYAEQLLIARVRHNRCIVKVSSGMFKMRANAISFSNPMPKIYNVLPPPIEELDEVLAFIYTGPCKPTKADF